MMCELRSYHLYYIRWGNYGTFRFAKIYVSFWFGDTFRFADYKPIMN